jgi:hypothetical protein
MSASEVPVTDDGRAYIKVAVLHRRLEREGIPVSRMVRAFGRDRTLDGALHPNFQPIYVGRARYLHPDCGEEWGLNFLRSMEGGRESKPTEAIEAALS